VNALPYISSRLTKVTTLVFRTLSNEFSKKTTGFGDKNDGLAAALAFHHCGADAMRAGKPVGQTVITKV
jgi:hypothetical protein